MPTGLHGFERGPDGYFGLAKPYVAADKAIHGIALLHVALDFFDCAELARRFHPRERLFHLALERGVGSVWPSLDALSLGVELNEVAGEGFRLLLRFSQCALPLTSRKLVELGSFVAGIEVLLDAIELVGGDEEFVRSLIFDVEKLFLHALDRLFSKSAEDADAEVHVHHEIARA